jgi:hypothetical protein
MPEATRHDTTDKGTLRLNAKPIPKTETHFEPIQLLLKPFQIALPDTVSPNEPLSLFLLYFNSEMIEIIAQSTNLYMPSTDELLTERARVVEWYRTLPGELYIYLAIRIYTTLYVENEISNY